MEDIAIVVDETDKIIGYKNRSELLDTDRWRICSVLLVNDKGEVLIAQRSANKRHSPLKWGPSCAGTLSKGESYEECAKRELEEELGVTTESLDVVLYDKYDGYNGSKRYCKTFMLQNNWAIEQFIVQDDEVEALRWISIEEFKRELRESPENFVSGVDFFRQAVEKMYP